MASSTCIVSWPSHSPVSTSTTSAHSAPRSSSITTAQVSSCILSSPVTFLFTNRSICPKIREQSNLLPNQRRFPHNVCLEDTLNRKHGFFLKNNPFKLFCLDKIRSIWHGSEYSSIFQSLRWKIRTQSVHHHDFVVKRTTSFSLEVGSNFPHYNLRTSSRASSGSEEVEQDVSHEEIRTTPMSPFFNIRDDETLIRKAALAADADTVLAIIATKCSENPQGLVLTLEDCCILVRASLAENNANLAFSILNAMRGSQMQRRVGSVTGCQWPQPDVRIYIALIKGLTASLRVADALRVVGDIKRRGIPDGEEVPFGKVVKCPTCDTALAVVQPHHGFQLVPCSKCRYQYELMSGDVVDCESESISMNISAFERALRALQLKKYSLPSAVHSFVIKSPDGMARTYRFATASADVPAQQGERITVAAAAPEDSARGIGPFKINARARGWRPSEPMSITNHLTGSVYPLLRAPPKSGSGADLDTNLLVPVIFLLASSDAATALIDPTLPRTLAVTATAAAVFGTAANNWILPILNQLPQRTADAVALRQELLAQYEVLQERLQELTQGAAEEVRILARLCQLQNKMEAVQEPTYSARLERIGRAREGLDERLTSRLELIDSYAKVSSMIEIEVEMDIDVLAAEEGAAMANIAAQIEQLEEAESLQKQWRMQAEVNDEVERLLQSSPVLTDA